ncbi:hypothetical protein [Streptomyces viridochromogenes]|uniref:hypothetical protein n=1 Tax=Streptomyces viridochromogenes TaxID=1938 RepID=UPI00069D13D0|nr:hypothetical protein [Streptomyces viridochromogenes]KOG25585.1 hypothetical protein ADK36_04985 [Streptomyces viridochromogenes]KOG26648.1 hypothetical protein ADK35_06595 [Streptomyces viridochromogenes]
MRRLGGVPAEPDVRGGSTVPNEPTAPRDGEDQSQIQGQVLRPVIEHVTQAVGTHVVQHVVQPVGDVIESVTGELPAAQTPTWPSWPGTGRPEFPDFPTFPGSPTFPEFPGFPGTDLPAFPELPAVPGQTLPAPVTWTPQPGFEAPEPGAARDDEGRTGKEADADVAYGPRFVVGTDVTASHAPAPRGVHSGAPSGYAPVQQAPVEHPGGVQGNRSAGDNSTPRYGDAHAVSLNPRAPLRLVPGAAARVEADEIQDRHRDIPVSPA